ncbi:trafficking protein Mon1-domain-containing protein [Pelagophyceae sp. CCMP2097]|nr:trafficking protein Mon1-domain-containing protein [Pelagophyceae sp. CCMP2097]
MAAMEESAAMEGETEQPAEGAQRRVYVMTLAGKQVWSSNRESEAAATGLAGLVSAVCGLAQRFGDAPRAVLAGNQRIVFSLHGELVFVAVDGRQSSEAYLLRTLGLVHDAVLMVLTKSVHTVLQKTPGYDVRALLGLSFILASAQRSGAERERSFAYAFVLLGDKLVAALQPRDLASRLHSTDVLLLANFVASQKSVFAQAESWTPVCLPRFNASGFVHAYVAYLDAGVELCLVLIAADGSPETFEALRGIRVAIETAAMRDGVVAHARKVAQQPDQAPRAVAQHNKALHFCCNTRKPRLQPQSPNGGAFRKGRNRASQAYLTQSACSPYASQHEGGNEAPPRLWHAYQEIAMRRRGRTRSLGPLSMGDIDVLTISDELYDSHLDGALCCITAGLFTYVGLSGLGLDLFATFPAHLPLLVVADKAQQLLNTLKLEEAFFFVDVNASVY